MANAGGGRPNERTLISSAFPGDEAPPELSVAIVSLVELCQQAMPDPVLLHKRIVEAGFAAGPEQNAAVNGAPLALDDRVFSFPVRNLRHQIFGRNRNEHLVTFLLTQGDSDQGPVVFCSTLFRDAIEADAVKAATHVTKKTPLTGATTKLPSGVTIRRVFWDTGGEAGIRGLMVTGPDNVEDVGTPRAFTAFNLAGPKRG